MLWFNFILQWFKILLFFAFGYYNIIYDDEFEKKEILFEPSINLNQTHMVAMLGVLMCSRASPEYYTSCDENTCTVRNGFCWGSR